jgi:hypothetical protein
MVFGGPKPDWRNLPPSTIRDQRRGVKLLGNISRTEADREQIGLPLGVFRHKS